MIELEYEFESYSSCARFLGCDRGTIRKICSNRYPKNKTIRGYHVRLIIADCVMDDDLNDFMERQGYKTYSLREVREMKREYF